MLADYLLIIESLIVILSIYLSFRYGFVVRGFISKQREVGDIVEIVIDSIDKKMARYDERMIDLLYRVDLLEAKDIRGLHEQEVKAKDFRMKIMNESTGDITTTELTVLGLLSGGSVSSVEVQRVLGKSREHVARIMKGLFEAGYVIRDERRKPFRYNLTELGRSKITVADGS